MNKTILSILSKEQIEQMNKMPTDEFVKSCEKAGRLFNNKKTKIDLKFEEIYILLARMGFEDFELRVQISAKLLELKELIKQGE